MHVSNACTSARARVPSFLSRFTIISDSSLIHFTCKLYMCVAYFAIRQKEKRINVRQYFCVKNRKNDEKTIAFSSRKKMYARMCVLHEAMIFVHILKCKCIPARYRCVDKDAKDVLVLGKVHITKRLYVYIAVWPLFSSYCSFDKI